MHNYSPKILITGSDGQLGMALRHHTRAQSLPITACTRHELDITDAASIHKAIERFQPDVIINTAAYTAVDKAEQEIEQALRVNHLGVRHLAMACAEHQIFLIHISTDYVFDGTVQTAHLESDPTHPVNRYGESKCLGEQAIGEHCPQHIILRVSGVFSQYGSNFLKTILRLANEKKELHIVSDQIICPTAAHDIASAIFTLASQPLHTGTYHYSSAQAVSWHQFACAIIAEAKQYHSLYVEEVKAITTAEYPTAAKRPAYSVLDCSKIKKDYQIMQPDWRLSMQATLKDLHHA
jgi:dTDP-4-dehydrorhamnose reductase